jgi:hypothetical protein
MADFEQAKNLITDLLNKNGTYNMIKVSRFLIQAQLRTAVLQSLQKQKPEQTKHSQQGNFFVQ